MSVKRYDVMSYSLDVDGNSGPFVKYEDYSALEARCAALAAENAGLKAAHADAIGTITKTINRGSEVYSDTPIKFSVETPATDAFLAEVRASAVEEFVRMADYSESVADGEVIVTSCSVFAAGHEYAAQIRKGVQS